MILYKKREVYATSLYSIQARHQFFDWKLETRRERVPSAPLAFLWKSKKPNEGHLTPPPSFKKLGKVAIILLIHLQKRTNIKLKHHRVLVLSQTVLLKHHQ